SGASVLVVDDDAGSTYENQIVSAIPSTIAAGTIRSGATLIDYSLMANFQAVIWFTGDDYGSAITAEDIINIEAYLDNGGKLLLIGQDIAYNIDTNGIAGGTAFLNNYLGVNYVYDDANVNSVSGVSGNPISDGFNGMLLSGGTGAGNNNYPDVLSIHPLAQSVTTTIFTYVGGTYTGQTAAVAKTGNNNSKVVYLGFPFEAISSNYNRELLMNNILGWLGIQPLISLSATNLYYQNVPLVGGQASASQTLTISNIGGGTLDITSLNITGTGASSFSISNVTPPFSLTAGQSQNIIVDFNATAAGSKSATLAIANSLTTPKNIALFATVVTGIEDQNNVPLEYSISQNYPNPFNPETKINYTLKESGNVKITVYNALGQIVKTLVNENKGVGTRHEIVWNGTDDKGNLVSSGTYFYKIEAGSFSEIKKMLFLK
ncbi:choice-of-anchor D domain-containing protein, partial [bacterium]|nr:choice-of-anchor D domain-containing protein [bacterium]